MNDTIPRSVSLGSQRKRWFRCDECNYPFESTVNNVSNGSWCPFCAGRTLCGNEKCVVCHEKSFIDLSTGAEIRKRDVIFHLIAC